MFVVEQHCAYPDVDGHDVEPRARHRWLAPAGDATDIRAYLRVLADGDALRIGRVVTAAAARGQGLAGRLVAAVVAEHGASQPLVLDAQAHLAGLYDRFGFARCGPDFLEDGIPHTPMCRPAH